MMTMRSAAGRTLFPLMVLGLVNLAAATARADDEASERAVGRAHNFLSSAKRGREVLNYVHFGAKYMGHTYQKTLGVTNAGKRVPGHFALVYAYNWNTEDMTEVIFLCDNLGKVY